VQLEWDKSAHADLGGGTLRQLQGLQPTSLQLV